MQEGGNSAYQKHFVPHRPGEMGNSSPSQRENTGARRKLHARGKQ